MGWTFLLQHKEDTVTTFLEWKASVERQPGVPLKALRSDNGGEYIGRNFSSYFKSQGIRHEFSIAYNPEQNGTAERFNKTILEMARSMLQGAGAGVHQQLWGEAVMAATHTRNLCPTTGTLEDKTPQEMFFGNPPGVHHLRPWGCKVSVLIPEHRRSKFGPRSYSAVMVGYGDDRKGYRVYNPSTRTTEVAKHVKFLEEEFASSSGNLGVAKFSWPDAPETAPTPPPDDDDPLPNDPEEEEGEPLY